MVLSIATNNIDTGIKPIILWLTITMIYIAFHAIGMPNHTVAHGHLMINVFTLYYTCHFIPNRTSYNIITFYINMIPYHNISIQNHIIPLTCDSGRCYSGFILVAMSLLIFILNISESRSIHPHAFNHVRRNGSLTINCLIKHCLMSRWIRPLTPHGVRQNNPKSGVMLTVADITSVLSQLQETCFICRCILHVPVKVKTC